MSVRPRMIKQLCWSEKDLPQKMRTKHVHSLHPYLGKFVPQLVDYFLKRDLKGSKLVCDPFMGSGTTLIESNVNGIPSIGFDISRFNVLLCDVKTRKYDIGKLQKTVNSILESTLAAASKSSLDDYIPERSRHGTRKIDSEYLNTWYHPEALHPLLVFSSLIPEYGYQDVLKIILSRAARSSRMIAHYEVDFPKKPYDADYYCLKHDRICHPTKNSIAFLKRYCKDVVARISEFQSMRKDVYTKPIHSDSSRFDFSSIKISNVFTSPPYIGLIDYHNQHKYAYELLRLEDNSHREIGRKRDGSSKRAISNYKKGISRTIKNIAESSFNKDSKFIIVVNDKLDLYDDIVSDGGMVIEKRLTRKVNRRSGRRASAFNEDILVCGL